MRWIATRRRRLAARLIVALLGAAWLACATPGPPAEEAGPGCRPDFRFRDGWLGGDAAYSIALPLSGDANTRPTLWLFGDSFVSETPRPDRRGAAFVHNSIGVSHCSEQGFQIEYHWGHDTAGAATAFFDAASEHTYWWLFDGFVHEGALYVGLLEIEEAEPDPVLEMPFRMVGMKLARIDDPAAPPAEWRPQITTLLRSDRAFPGGAMLILDDYVYFFTFTVLTHGRQPRLLVRLPLSALSPYPEDLSPQLETWTRGGNWKAGWLPEDALPVMEDNATEMSVEHHAAVGKWIAIYSSPIQTTEDGRAGSADALSDEIFVRHAVRLEGPWSEREALYVMPEVGRAARGEGDPNTICYAAKGHDAFASSGGLLVTYVCNLRTKPGEDPYAVLQRLQTNMELYRPIVVEPALSPGLLAECAHPMSDLWDGLSDCLVVP